MYLHEIESALTEGKAARRLSWEKSERLYKLRNGIELDIDERERKALGLKKEAEVEVPEGTLVFVSGGKAIVGYVMTYEDRNHQDWEVL